MASEEKKNSSSDPDNVVQIPLSDYAKKLDGKVRERYVKKISRIGIDPALIEGKHFEPDCLPPVELTDLLCYLVLETSFYKQKQFKAFRSLEAYNQMVSGFVYNVQGHMIASKFVVLAKVRHSQRMNEALIPIWIITEKDGTINYAHCLGCKAGLAESCSHIASVLFYLEAWTKVNGRLACTQMKCSWILPSFASEVEYARVRDINFKSVKKLKVDLDEMIENLSEELELSGISKNESAVPKPEVPAPSQAEVEEFYSKLSKCNSKPVVLSLVPPYAQSYVLPSRNISTVMDLFKKENLELSYNELLKLCQSTSIDITKEKIDQVQKDTISQSSGANFFKHRAGRIGASQSKAAAHSDPALPSQSLIQRICCPELHKVNTKAVRHGCKHEASAISAFEESMKKTHTNFKVIKCGLFINEENPWMHATPDFLCSCDCCGEFWRICVLPEVLARWYTRRENVTVDGASLADATCYCRQETVEETVKCCNPNCPIQQFHLSCLGIDGIPKTWYCPNCRALPEFKRGSSKKQSAGIINEAMKMDLICTCKAVAEKKDKLVKCSNAHCTNGKFFHLSCLGRKRMPNNSKSWLRSVCFVTKSQEPMSGTPSKPTATKTTASTNPTVTHTTTNTKPTVMHITTNTKPTVTHTTTNTKPTVTHIKTNTKPTVTHTTTNTKPTGTKPTVSSDTEGITIVKTVHKERAPRDKYAPEGKLGKYEYDLIASPNGWLDCVIIHEAHIILKRIGNLKGIQGFQRPTLGPVRQFDIMTGPFIQIVNINNNHWICFSSIHSPPGYVDVHDSLSTPVTQEIIGLAYDLTGPAFQGIRCIPVQQQKNLSDCGVFSIAFATSLVYGQYTMNLTYNINQMRPHLMQCLKGGNITPFPTT